MDSRLQRQKGSHHQFHNPRQPQRFPPSHFYRQNLSNQAPCNNYEDNYSQSSQLNIQVQEWSAYNPPSAEYASPPCGSPIPPNIPPVTAMYPTMYDTVPQDGNMIINTPLYSQQYLDFNCAFCKLPNVFWKLQVEEKIKIIIQKDEEIANLHEKIKGLQEDLKKERRLMKSSESVNNNVGDKNERSITQSQLSVDAPEFNFNKNLQVPVVSANGDASRETNYANEEPSPKNGNSVYTSDENVNIVSEDKYIQDNPTDFKSDPTANSSNIDFSDKGNSYTTECQILPNTTTLFEQNPLNNQTEQNPLNNQTEQQLSEPKVEHSNNTINMGKSSKQRQNKSYQPGKGKSKGNESKGSGEYKQSSSSSRRNSDSQTSFKIENKRTPNLSKNISDEASSSASPVTTDRVSSDMNIESSHKRSHWAPGNSKMLDNGHEMSRESNNRSKWVGSNPSTSDGHSSGTGTIDKGNSSSTSVDRNSPAYDYKGYNKASKRYPEYEKYLKRPLNFKEITGDLFSAPEHFSLAHCVGSDFRMGSGIATTFKQNFKRVGELLEQKAKVGEVAYLKDKDRYIFYIVTKRFSTGKPTFDDFKIALTDLKAKCVDFEVTHLAIPRIGCGLDRLEWKYVRKEIINTFEDVNIEITVYNFEDGLQEKDYKSIQEKEAGQVKDKKRLPSRGPYFSERTQTLVEIQTETALIFLGTEDGHLDRTAVNLNQKFNFMITYKNEKKTVGDVVRIVRNNEVLYSLIVRKKADDPLSFEVLETCLRKLNRLLNNDKFYYVGFEAFNDPSDETTMAKIITLLRSVLMSKLELWVCWPPDVICHEKLQKSQNTFH